MKRTFFISSLALAFATVGLQAHQFRNDLTFQIPEAKISNANEGYQKIENVAQYKNADWSQAVAIARGVSLDEAYAIADENPEITFFFYTKGGQMVLELENGEDYRLFRHGDAVFFSGEPWWGGAPGLADGYVKKDLQK